LWGRGCFRGALFVSGLFFGFFFFSFVWFVGGYFLFFFFFFLGVFVFFFFVGGVFLFLCFGGFFFYVCVKRFCFWGFFWFGVFGNLYILFPSCLLFLQREELSSPSRKHELAGFRFVEDFMAIRVGDFFLRSLKDSPLPAAAPLFDPFPSSFLVCLEGRNRGGEPF